MTEAIVERVEAWHCRIPLDRPLRLADLVIPHRDFVVVRITTTDGLSGAAYALSRGSPVDVAVTELLGPLLTGRSAIDIGHRNEEMTRALVALGPSGVVQRAVSLVDICLWDIKGQAAGLPVWRLLGGYRDNTSVMVVAPYAADDETDLEYAERLAVLAERGYSAIKLYPLPDARAMARRLDAIRRRVDDRIGLVVDMAWSWRTVTESVNAVRAWEEYGLSWVEDPFPADQWRSIRALSGAVHTPIAAGDEVSVRGTMDRLIEEQAVDLVRLDATTIGGFTQFASVRDAARRVGYAVSPHAYPEIHRHCVFAWPDVEPLEIFPAGSPTWGTSRFLAAEMDLEADHHEMRAPVAPGLGLDIDWASVADLSVRATRSTR